MENTVNKLDKIHPSEKILHSVKIPIELVESEEDSFDLFDNRRILFFSAINFLKHPNSNGSESLFFKPKDILYLCGIKTDNRKGGNKDRLNKFMDIMKLKGYISENTNYNAYSTTKEYYLNPDIFNPTSRYGIITSDEFFHITSSYERKLIKGRTSSYNMLLVLAFFRNHIYNSTFQSGKAETCWRYYLEIAESLRITEKATSECIKALSDMDIIEYDRAPKYKLPNGTWVNGRIIFANKYKYSNSGNLRNNYSAKEEIKKCKHQLAGFHHS